VLGGKRNLRNVEIDFDEKRLTTVIIGQNGTGKSNLLEAITEIFRNADLDLAPPRFSFELDYRIDDHRVRIAGIGGEWNLVGDGKPLSRSEFAKRKAELFPDLVFGYYSGGNNRLEWLFNIHQRRYYGKIIREDTEAEKRVAIEDQADAKRCQFIIATHHPLTIAALEKEEVRVMFSDETGKAAVSAPYTDPKGMGFTATLTEIFGLSTSLDPDTQRQVDERNMLARIDKRTEQQDKQLIAINDRLNRLGFMFEDREPLYQDFLRAMHNVRYADRPPLSPEQIEKRHAAMKELMKGLLAKKEAAT
jgi:hypothetical protein